MNELEIQRPPHLIIICDNSVDGFQSYDWRVAYCPGDLCLRYGGCILDRIEEDQLLETLALDKGAGVFEAILYHEKDEWRLHYA